MEVMVQPDEEDDEQVVRYMTRNRAKNMPCCSGQMGSPRKRNLNTFLWLSLLLLLSCLLGKDG